MDEQGLREQIEDVRAGRLSRRRFVQRRPEPGARP